MTAASPKITNLSWGRIEVENHGIFKDVKLYPDGAKEWNWGETGANHSPGIQYSDVQELIDNKAEVIILSKGVLGRLQVSKDLVTRLESEGYKVYILKTKRAVKLYNDLAESQMVGALIHTTC